MGGTNEGYQSFLDFMYKNLQITLPSTHSGIVSTNNVPLPVKDGWTKKLFHCIALKIAETG